MAASVVLVATGMLIGQSTGQVYHFVGPAMFTNSVALGFADGQRVGSNFICGVYTGTASNALAPNFGPANSYLKRAFRADGFTPMWGSVVVNAPAKTPILLQFRAWPAAFGSYEEAVGWSNPSPPVGSSGIVLAIPENVIAEFTVEVGPVWLSPLAGTGAVHGPLASKLTDKSLILSWPTNSGNWMIVGAGSLGSDAVWSAVGGAVVVTNGYNEMAVPVSNEDHFFRLTR